MLSAKVLLLGDIGVGKSSLVRRLVFNCFDAEYRTTIGADVLTHEIGLGGDCANARMRLVLWDSDGDLGERIFDTAYPAGSSAAVVVADASRPATMRTMAALAAAFAQRFPQRPLMRIVNKIDLAPHIGESLVETAAPETLFSSAKTGAGVPELFLALGSEIWLRFG